MEPSENVDLSKSSPGTRLRVIDAHQHFWKYDTLRDNWITPEMSVIRKDFIPEDLEPVLKANGIDGCVSVQADQSETETDFLLELSHEHDFIKGAVGWIDLLGDDVEERLQYYSSFKKLKGFRHVLQSEPDERFMLGDKFKNGISLLSKYDLTYDILIYPKHLQYAAQLVAEFPDQRFVIDHIAKPYIKTKNIDNWQKDMEAIAQYENVWCKISGMVTEADWEKWQKDDFAPYFDVVVNAFGTERIMFGSDWPVCLVAASYESMIQIVKSYFAPFSTDEQENFFSKNAIEFYNI